MQKELSLVWIVYHGEYVLMGKQAPGKKLAGKRIGFGGKCMEGESTVECAKREVGEELQRDFFPSDFLKAGSFRVSEKQIDCFVIHVSEMFPEPVDNEEFVDVKWIPLDKINEYAHEMLPGDEVIVANMLKYINDGIIFDIVKEETQELKDATKNIFK